LSKTLPHTLWKTLTTISMAAIPPQAGITAAKVEPQ